MEVFRQSAGADRLVLLLVKDGKDEKGARRYSFFWVYPLWPTLSGSLRVDISYEALS